MVRSLLEICGPRRSRSFNSYTVAVLTFQSFWGLLGLGNTSRLFRKAVVRLDHSVDGEFPAERNL